MKEAVSGAHAKWDPRGGAGAAARDLGHGACAGAFPASLMLFGALAGAAALLMLSLVAVYRAGIALIDGFEWLMHVGTVLGANPFGWTL